MAYVICLGIFAVALIAFVVDLIVVSIRGSNELGYAIGMIIILILVISGLISLIWTFCGGYEYITKPEYNYVLSQDVGIPEFDTKKEETTKHDIVYIDSYKGLLYVDSSIYKDERIVVFESEKTHLEIYKCIPKNNSHSVDLILNRTYSYKVYVPKDYKVEFIDLID